MRKSWEKCCSSGQIDKLDHFGPFVPFSAKLEFLQKNSTWSVWSTYGHSTSSKISENNNDPIMEKMW